MKQIKICDLSRKRVIIISLIILSCLVAIWCHNYYMSPNSQFAKVQEIAAGSRINEPIQPIPLEIKLNNKKVELGAKLFHDRQLSHNNSISCASCHNLNTGGVDRLAHSWGINRAVTARNTPTVFNSEFNFVQGWDGRASTLSELTDRIILDPKVMGSNWQEIISKLVKLPNYVKEFAQIYPDSITAENIKDAISMFERSLSTPNSRFDKFISGQRNALTLEEKLGYKIFKEYGCVTCHQGVNVGGNLFQKFGATENYFVERGNPSVADLGRFNVTKDEADRYVFKVPSLRNIVLTAPYLHNGTASTLKEAIDIMAEYQLGRKLSLRDKDLIIKFLNTLTGEYQGKNL